MGTIHRASYRNELGGDKGAEMGSKDRLFDSPNNGSLKSVVPV